MLKKSTAFAALLIAISTLVFPQAGNADVSSGLVAYYPFDGNANDLSGNNRNGTAVNGVTYVPGVKGQAANFNGTSYIGASSDGLPTGERTVSLWFFARSIKMPRPVLLGYGGSFCGASWFVMLDPPPAPPFYISGHCHSYDLWAPSLSVEQPLGAWYHLAITTSAAGTRFFVNAQNVASSPQFISNTAVLPGRHLMIGVDVSSQGWGPYTDSNVGYFDGAIDELRIYNRALSQAEIAELYSPELRISTKSLPAAQLGRPISSQLRAAGGQPPYFWEAAGAVLPSGLSLSADGLLSGTPSEAGDTSLTLRVMDSAGAIAASELTQRVLLAAPPPNIRIHLTGAPPVPNRELDVFALIENVGDVASDAMLVTGLLDPWYSVIGTAQGAALATSEIRLRTPVPNAPRNAVTQLDLTVPSVDAGEATIVAFRTRLDSRYPLNSPHGLQLCMAPPRSRCPTPYIDSDCLDQCLEQVRTSCLLPNGYEVDHICYVNGTFTCQRNCSRCGAETARSTALISVAAAPQQSPAFTCDTWEALTRGALDPNEKLVTAKKFVRSDQLLGYPIHFENIGTIEARDVFVRDTLDPNLDLGTLTFITPGGTLDASTRTASWSLLNKNLLPGAGDSVLLSIRPRPGLPSGTVIRNAAIIQFEAFQPISTNEISVTIDDVPPRCVLTPLSTQVSTATFTLSWSGTDPVGEIDGYWIWVSTDGGRFAPLLEGTRETSTIIQGTVGKRYGFLCVAKDTAGNIESKPAVPETSTLVVMNSVPEAGTLSLVILGLGMLLFMAHRSSRT